MRSSRRAWGFAPGTVVRSGGRPSRQMYTVCVFEAVVAVALGVADGAALDAVAVGDATTGALVNGSADEPPTGPRSAVGRVSQNPMPIATTAAAAAPVTRCPRISVFWARSFL